jgi:hypothetical protein
MISNNFKHLDFKTFFIYLEIEQTMMTFDEAITKLAFSNAIIMGNAKTIKENALEKIQILMKMSKIKPESSLTSSFSEIIIDSLNETYKQKLIKEYAKSLEEMKELDEINEILNEIKEQKRIIKGFLKDEQM